ncbi:RNA polymerase-binding protein DksA [Ramlibacter sp.]|uniref:RNA polymerase-binding protein DksA n=1 Tax=Ramlibacter sp. TaxID=1917967 RepID=UPI0025D5DD64|nr:RNA polymerase-binding protein DksA [Ramlibacter sp.]
MKPQPKAAAKAKQPVAKAKPAPHAAAKAAKPAAKPAKPAAVSKPGAKAAELAKKPAAKAVPAKKASVPAPAPPAVKKTVAAKAPAPAPAAKAPAAKPGVQAKSTASAAVSAPASIRSTQPAAPARRSSVPPARPQSSLPQSAPPKPATVASNAAKASYIPMASPPSVITPPPAVAIKKDPKLANNWKTKSAEELSDDEVLAMPDTEYMNEKQMAFFRLKLVQLKTDILNSAGETTEHLREDTVIVPDPADRATIEEEHALELRTRDRERKLLKKIEQSIGRIDAGDYGYCDETGEPIGVGRLLARPTATLSLEAQQRRELKQKMFGD